MQGETLSTGNSGNMRAVDRKAHQGMSSLDVPYSLDIISVLIAQLMNPDCNRLDGKCMRGLGSFAGYSPFE